MNLNGWGTWIRTRAMSDSESDALPLGDAPSILAITIIALNLKTFYKFI